MKKFLSVLAASALCVSLGASVGANLLVDKASAEEASHIVTSEASANGLKPFAWYQFEDSDNLGKDTMGNFDLKMKVSGTGVCEQKEKTEGDKYVELRRKSYEEGYKYEYEAPAENGVLFYAPFVKDGLDMSDLITDSFTVSITFRSPTINTNLGAYYMFTTGRYIDAPSMVCWGKGIRVQTASKLGVFGETTEQKDIDNDTTCVRISPDGGASENAWYTITMVGDADRSEVKLYLDGALKQTVKLDGDVKFSNQGQMGLGSDYVFALGGQTAGTGGMHSHADIDISDCKVFDYALSDENVSALENGTTTEYTGTYVDSVPELDVSGVDFQLTDANTMSDVLNELPSTISVTLSDGSKSKASIAWIKGDGKCVGIIQSPIANAKGYFYEYACEYVVKFNYNSEHVTISDITVGKQTMNPDEVLVVDGSVSMSLSFKIETKDSCSIKGVYYDDTNEFIEELWAGDDEGYMYIRIKEGAEILIVSQSNEDVPPVSSDSTSSSTSSSGNSESNGTSENKKKGCGSVAFGAFAPVAVLAVVAAVCKKERK